MAFTLDQTQDDEQDKQKDSQALADPTQEQAPSSSGQTQQQPAQDTQVKELSSGESSVSPFGGAPGAGGQGAGAAASGSAKGTSSGSYTNLQDYLKANQGSDFGGQVAGRLNSDIAGAGQQVKNADQSFQQQVKSGSTDYNADLINSAISDPTSVANDADQSAAVQAQLNAKYSGPNNLSDQSSVYNPTQSAVSTAQQEAQSTDSDTGRWSLLNQYFGGGGKQYNQGQQALDSALLAADPNSQAGFQQARQTAQGLGTQWSQVQTDDAARAQQAAAATAAANANSRAAFGIDATGTLTGKGAIGDLQSGINSRVDAGNKQVGADYSRILQELKIGSISAADAKEIGLDSGAVNQGMFSAIAKPGTVGIAVPNYNTSFGSSQQTALDKSEDMSSVGGGSRSLADAYAWAKDIQDKHLDPAFIAPVTQSLMDKIFADYNAAKALPTGNTANVPANKINTFGLTGDQVAQLLSQGKTATAGNVASADEYSKMAALSKLAGVNNTFLPSDASQAGTFSAGPQFNTSQLQQQLNAEAQNQFNAALAGKQENEAQIGTDNHNLGAAYTWATSPEVQRGLAQNPALQATVNRIMSDYAAAQKGQGWNFGNSLNITG